MKAGEDGCPNSKTGREKEFLLIQPIILSRPSEYRRRPTHFGHSSLLSLQIKMLISCGNTLTETARNNVELNIWALCISVKLTHKTNHHTQEGSGKNKDNRENKNKDTRGNFQL